MDAHPNRPDHPDFWLLSEILIDQDTAIDHGGELEEAIRGIDLDSLGYAASQQAEMALAKLYPNASLVPRLNVAALIAAGFMSGFVAGQTFQTRMDIDHQAGEFPWVVDHFSPDLLPGERGELVGRFKTCEHAEKFIGIIAETDPEGVERGDYGVTGPSEDEPRG